ncbi:N(G),N(G)-dimethylarginine dimethylaminohydrolase 1 [Desmophyllum pertusum]|uniref:N(G),N(G)-dimethylarginine dimethylaminohydrolase 1 n=1 Tax=Desmophyllum pertusum TaxID=174260 RepID=A0A9X0CU07_9CNID|nr:N(G),N(G)-dimethylarginine dimethylaminohydrolase 1 [Desmophyllum pertusum]
MSGKESKFQYTKAIVCGVPHSLPAAAQRQNHPSEPVDFNKAVRQHCEYVRALKNIGLEVTELPADEQYPDCVFVEDVGVVCDGVALVARLGHPTRRGESTRMKTTLQKLGLVQVVEMNQPALLDGGDDESSRIEQFSRNIPQLPCDGISVTEHLHLKSMMTMASDDIIVVGGSDEAQNAWLEVEKKAKFQYKKLMVPDDTAANCMFVNGTLIHLATAEIPNSVEVFNQIPGQKMELENSELSKVDGCLTCLSILLM